VWEVNESKYLLENRIENIKSEEEESVRGIERKASELETWSVIEIGSLAVQAEKPAGHAKRRANIHDSTPQHAPSTSDFFGGIIHISLFLIVAKLSRGLKRAYFRVRRPQRGKRFVISSSEAMRLTGYSRGSAIPTYPTSSTKGRPSSNPQCPS
jgi:hypothetical protein